MQILNAVDVDCTYTPAAATHSQPPNSSESVTFAFSPYRRFFAELFSRKYVYNQSEFKN